MKIIICYDVSQDDDGKYFLVKVAKCCENYGVRVQYSLFEYIVNHSQYLELKNKLISIINKKYDSLRIYNLSNN